MTNPNAVSANNPALPTLSDLQTDATILHGLVQALEELDGSTTPQAFQGSGALLVAIERMARKLVNDLEEVAK